MGKVFLNRGGLGAIDYMIVGLGNPGNKYTNTRHNVGFAAADLMAKEYGAKLNKLRFKSLYSIVTIGDSKVLLMKPQTFMNLSGQSVVEAMQFYKLKPAQCIIVFDDATLDLGTIRIRRKGSDGGHNGMKNIIYLTASDEFPRVKIGVGKKTHPDMDLADFVLSEFDKTQAEAVGDACCTACKALKHIIANGIDGAMNLYSS